MIEVLDDSKEEEHSVSILACLKSKKPERPCLFEVVSRSSVHFPRLVLHSIRYYEEIED